MNDQLVKTLAELIACDTQNPPRAISASHPVFQVVRDHLPREFQFDVTDYGSGCVSMLARRGRPETLFNVHLDTVPVGERWTSDPLTLAVHGDRLIGRGVCDNKGAAAALIHAARRGTESMAILFTTDEEGSDNQCVRRFCDSPAASGFSRVVVAEPTGCQAILEHRGYLSVSGQFTGVSGHTAEFTRLGNSAVHRCVTWAADCLATVARHERAMGHGYSLCFNLGRIEGGTKNNVIADQCGVSWSMRPPAGTTTDRLIELVSGGGLPGVDWSVKFSGGPLPAGEAPGPRLQSARQWCEARQVAVGQRVDFWTEASLFSAAGFPAIVLGPGNIAQAHTANEWIAAGDLEQAVAVYHNV